MCVHISPNKHASDPYLRVLDAVWTGWGQSRFTAARVDNKAGLIILTQEQRFVSCAHDY